MKYLLLKNELRSQPIPKFRIYCAVQASSSSSLSLVSLHNKGLTTLSVKYNKAIFAVINSTQAWQIQACKNV